MMTELVVFVVAPSPKTHVQFVTVPSEASVKVTVNGTAPAVGEPVKFGIGGALPVTGFVLTPPLLAKMTLSVKTPGVSGVKPTTTLVEPKAAMLNELPDKMLNGLPPTVAVPVRVPPPPFVTVKLTCAVTPVGVPT